MTKRESEKKFVAREDFILISRPEDIEILKEAGFTEGSSYYWNGHINVSKTLWKREQKKQGELNATEEAYISIIEKAKKEAVDNIFPSWMRDLKEPLRTLEFAKEKAREASH